MLKATLPAYLSKYCDITTIMNSDHAEGVCGAITINGGESFKNDGDWTQVGYVEIVFHRFSQEKIAESRVKNLENKARQLEIEANEKIACLRDQIASIKEKK